MAGRPPTAPLKESGGLVLPYLTPRPDELTGPAAPVVVGERAVEGLGEHAFVNKHHSLQTGLQKGGRGGEEHRIANQEAVQQLYLPFFLLVTVG